jgi:hypothetical protein
MHKLRIAGDIMGVAVTGWWDNCHLKIQLEVHERVSELWPQSFLPAASAASTKAMATWRIFVLICTYSIGYLIVPCTFNKAFRESGRNLDSIHSLLYADLMQAFGVPPRSLSGTEVCTGFFKVPFDLMRLDFLVDLSEHHRSCRVNLWISR